MLIPKEAQMASTLPKMLLFQIKTEDFEVIGTNKHRGDNKNVAWNDAVEIIINSKFCFKS